jgi:hypothetical protein
MSYDSINELLSLLAPVILVQLGLLALALRDLIGRERVRLVSKPVWALVIVLVNILGPIVYFAVGRED